MGSRSAPAQAENRAAGGRIELLDLVRGAALVSMVGFHACYDLVYIAGMSLPWFGGWLQDLWRASISWTFLLLAGLMVCHSRNNLRRAARYLVVAGLIFAVTLVAAVDDPISFGIIYCMGAATLISGLLAKVGRLPEGPLWALGLFLAFLLLLGLPSGAVGLGPWQIALPRALYATPWLSWLGLPGPGYVSADYYPLLPFGLLYGAGVALGPAVTRAAARHGVFHRSLAPLNALGRHSLAIYVAHQPVILALIWLCTGGAL